MNFRQRLVKNNLILRSKIIQGIRDFFLKRDFLEVETPNRIPAPAPELNIDAETSGNWFLHTSPELCMKRLICAGYLKIFQICHVYRKKERGNKHLPEFTLLEWYSAGSDYKDMMCQCEELINDIAYILGIKDNIIYQNETIDFSLPWERISVAQAFKNYTSISMEEALLFGKFDELMAFEIEPNLGRNKPVFLYDYPTSKGALAKKKDNDHNLVERFELYISGIELCNAFSELTDPEEQRKRFEQEQEDRRKNGKSEYPMPEKFLEELKYLPATSGNALGIDRLVMLFADTTNIDNVVPFTQEEL